MSYVQYLSLSWTSGLLRSNCPCSVLTVGGALLCHCQEIDEYVEKAKDQSCAALIALGSRGFTFATNLILSTAAKVVMMRVAVGQ